MKRPGLIFALALLVTGIDTPAQDITTIESSSEMEAIGTTCVALAVFASARGRSYFTQALIAHAVLNRQSSLPSGSDACDAIESIPAIRAWPFPRDPWRIDNSGWLKAVEVAQVVMSGDYYIPPPCFGADAFGLAGGAIPAGKAPACEVEGLAFYSPVDALAQTLLTTGGKE